MSGTLGQGMLPPFTSPKLQRIRYIRTRKGFKGGWQCKCLLPLDRPRRRELPLTMRHTAAQEFCRPTNGLREPGDTLSQAIGPQEVGLLGASRPLAVLYVFPLLQHHPSLAKGEQSCLFSHATAA